MKTWNILNSGTTEIKKYKTIFENERMEEFTEISSVEEMFSYMKKKIK